MENFRQIDKKTWLISLAILLLIFRTILFSGFTNAGNDTNYLTPLALKSISLLPQTWESFLGGVDLGHNQILSMWMQPLLTLFSLLARGGLTFPTLVKIMIALQLVLGTYGLNRLLSRFRATQSATIISTLFYFSNTYFLTVVDGGLIFLSAAYALFPLILDEAIGLTVNFDKKKLGRLTLLLIIGQSFDLRLLPLFFICLFVWLCITIRSWSQLLRNLKILILIVIILGGWNMFWLWPALRQGALSYFTYANLPQVSQFSFASSGHLLAFSQPHWFNNFFGDVQSVRWYLWLIPALVIVALLANKDNSPSKKLLIAITLIGLFLAKGDRPPGGEVYNWLYQKIPGFFVFRDPSKFLFLASLGYAGLIATIPFKKIITIILIGYLIICASPAFLGLMSGGFSPHPDESNYTKLTQIIDADSSFGRVLWLPIKPPLGPISATKIWTESTHLLNKFPFLNLVDGSYELLNYLRSPAAPNLLDAIGVEYIVYPYPDERKRILKPDEKEYYYWFRNWFKEQPWLTDISWSDKLGVFKTQKHSDRFYLLDQVWWVIGSRDTYATPSAAVVHLESGIDFTPQLKDSVVFNNATDLDLVMTQIPQSYLIPASKHLTGEKWWKRESRDFLFVRNYLQDRYKIKFSDSDWGFGYVISEGTNKSESFSFERTGDLYIRLLLSRAGKSIEILRNKIDTSSPRNNFAWVYVGEYPSGTPLEIKSEGNINIINAFAVIPKEKISEIKNKTLSQITNNKSAITNKPLPVPYVQKSPTFYSLNVPEGNQWLVFSESFDPRWLLKKSDSPLVLTPSPIYDMLNGYFVPFPGKYVLEYQPQKYVRPGLLITLITLIIVIGVAFWPDYEKKRIR